MQTSDDSGERINTLSSAQLRRWEEHGWILLDSAFPQEKIDAAAQQTLSSEFPEHREFEPRDTISPFDTMTTFPFRSDAANDICASHTLQTIAQQILNSEVQLYQAQLWMKRAGYAKFEQSHHRDYAKNTMLTPRNGDGSCDFLAFIIYLSDVTASSGPTAMVSRSITASRPLEPGRLRVEDAPEIYDQEELACGPRGSLLLYAGDTFHRATELNAGGSRLVIKGAVRKTGATWVNYVHGLRVGFEPEWSIFMNRASREQVEFITGRTSKRRIDSAYQERYPYTIRSQS
ncbi:phytanoyl-CoA dioxygenase family protein [Nocardia sp. CA-135398]|uniref:phytanoyl-CoA dioxygenase family protein n=1 Tax=Nocardia sp. CA-135398 TaxID=3239977 RepID=UPI003D970908